MKAMPHRFRSGTDDDRFWHRAENLSSAITSAAIWVEEMGRAPRRHGRPWPGCV